jgi:hypothetical protein
MDIPLHFLSPFFPLLNKVLALNAMSLSSFLEFLDLMVQQCSGY